MKIRILSPFVKHVLYTIPFLVIVSLILIWKYEEVFDNNVYVMIFELSYAFIGAYWFGRYFFDKDRLHRSFNEVQKNTSENKFKDYLSRIYTHLKRASVTDYNKKALRIHIDLQISAQWCELCRDSLRIFEPSNVELINKLDFYRERILEINDKIKNERTSQFDLKWITEQIEEHAKRYNLDLKIIEKL